jgi:hypothetical protein
MRWYVSHKGKASGPYEEERLAMLVHWGKVSRDAFICDAQCSTWISIQRSAFAPLFPKLAPAVAAGAEKPSAADGHGEPRVIPLRTGTFEQSRERLLGWFTASVLLAGVLVASWL